MRENCSLIYNQEQANDLIRMHTLHLTMGGEWGRLAVCRNIDFSKLSFKGANLRGATFTQCIFDGATFENADLYRAEMSGSILNGTDLRFANLKGVSLVGANCDNSSFFGAFLKDANFTNASLEAVLFNEATLTRAIFEGANTNMSCFRSADLSGSRGMKYFQLSSSGKTSSGMTLVESRGEKTFFFDKTPEPFCYKGLGSFHLLQHAFRERADVVLEHVVDDMNYCLQHFDRY